MKNTKCFASCDTWFSVYRDGTIVACPYLRAIAPEGCLENDYPFDTIWFCSECEGWTLSPDWDEEEEIGSTYWRTN